MFTTRVIMLIMNYFHRIVNFYIEGFKNMQVGKTLWLIIAIKLFIMFAILKVFFFPNFLNERCESDEDKQNFVSNELIKRINP